MMFDVVLSLNPAEDVSTNDVVTPLPGVTHDHNNFLHVFIKSTNATVGLQICVSEWKRVGS